MHINLFLGTAKYVFKLWVEYLFRKEQMKEISQKTEELNTGGDSNCHRQNTKEDWDKLWKLHSWTMEELDSNIFNVCPSGSSPR